MADYFYDGQRDYIQRLNQMYGAFATGPYNALPLTGGNLTGPVTSSSFISALAYAAGDTSSAAHSILKGVPSETSVGGNNEVARFAVGGTSGIAFNGCFSWLTNSGNEGITTKEGYLIKLRAFDVGSGVFSNDLFTFSGRGDFRAYGLSSAPACQFGPIPRTGPESVIAGINQWEGQANVHIPNSAFFTVSAGPAGSTAASAVNISTNTTTGRSIAAGGTINASGADYAEYLIKSLLCGTIAPGQIVGIDSNGRLTDKWACAIAFMVKSTSPCMVGGDSWGQHLGQRPSAPVRVPPTVEQVLAMPAVPANESSGTEAVPAVYNSITTAPGDTDDEWSAKQASHEAAVIGFDIALEAARQTVDRIAFAGQVPVNVQGATPGQYIVPIQDGEGIAGLAINPQDMTPMQMLSAVGKVIAIEEDGRARIIVKVA